MFIMDRTTVGHIACMSAGQVLEVMQSWRAPVTMSVMRWQDVEEEDLSQQCPASHPFAFHNVGANTRIPRTSWLDLYSSLICYCPGQGARCCETFQEQDVSVSGAGDWVGVTAISPKECRSELQTKLREDFTITEGPY